MNPNVINSSADDEHFVFLASTDLRDLQERANDAWQQGYNWLQAVSRGDGCVLVFMERSQVPPTTSTPERSTDTPPRDEQRAFTDDADPVVTLLAAFAKLTHSQQIQFADQLPEVVTEYVKHVDDVDWLHDITADINVDLDTLPFGHWDREEHETDGVSE